MIEPITLSDFASSLDVTLIVIKRLIALFGGLIIFAGAVRGIIEYFMFFFSKGKTYITDIDDVRLRLGRNIVLGLEFIVASDVIGTTTAPDYYSLGLLAILVVIRTFLSYFMNRELNALKVKSES